MINVGIIKPYYSDRKMAAVWGSTFGFDLKGKQVGLLSSQQMYLYRFTITIDLPRLSSAKAEGYSTSFT